jgi:hypothetical protein
MGEQENARPGQLFSEGACVTDQTEAERFLNQMNQILAGPMEMDMFEPETNRTFKSDVNVSVLWKKPIQDLKTHIPTRFNECGQGIEFADETLEGILPNGDLKRVVDTRCN